ncbi:MAG: 1-acyl-sn-glycerol-3-phosphate acyltransferase [Melioribacteraceae bacterium]|nr:1-acyl-sn-glycerol-3-phosphate acyltransferase [Melioribacteraceae bacterium]
MNLEDYKKILALEDSYKTPENFRVPKKIWGSAAHIFLSLARVVLYSNKWVRNGLYDDHNWIHASVDLFKSFEDAGVKYDVKGMKNINSADGPVIFISNHMSTLETVLLPGMIHPRKKVVFITKKELTSYPVFGPVNSARDPIIVGRENAREDLKKVMIEGAERLNNGKSIIIFPQKTRSKYFSPQNFNSLGIKLARQNNVHIVPVALLTDAWDNGKYIKELGRIDLSRTVHFEFGKPFRVEGKGTEEQQKIVDFISAKLKEWGREEYIIE